MYIARLKRVCVFSLFIFLSFLYGAKGPRYRGAPLAAAQSAAGSRTVAKPNKMVAAEAKTLAKPKAIAESHAGNVGNDTHKTTKL